MQFLFEDKDGKHNRELILAKPFKIKDPRGAINRDFNDKITCHSMSKQSSRMPVLHALSKIICAHVKV